MAPQSRDFISKLPPECQSALVGYLDGKDAANLRLTSRAWSTIAAEGLFNHFTSTGGVVGSLNGYIKRAILGIRPWRSYGSIVEGLIEWPWMARHIKEIEIYLRDKHLDNLLAAADRAIKNRLDPDAPWPRDRLLEVVCDADADLAADQIPLSNIFGRLPYVEALGVFSEQCPFLPSEELLSFWCDLPTVDDWDEPPFGHQYQDKDAACVQYYDILAAIKHLKSPVRRLELDLAPFEVFELLEELEAEVPLNNLRDLHLIIVEDNLEELSSFDSRSFALSRFLDNMPVLKSLSLVWMDTNDAVPFLVPGVRLSADLAPPAHSLVRKKLAESRNPQITRLPRFRRAITSVYRQACLFPSESRPHGLLSRKFLS